jgi:vacuolar protein sorting-associated protein 13A/C
MESILLRLINTKLGNFVETVDAGALETNLLSGVIRLRNLRIKAEALASLKLPVKVVYGFVKDIKVEFSPMQVRTCVWV